MKKLIISLVVSAPLFLTSVSSVAASTAGSVAFDRADSSNFVYTVGNYSGKSVVGTQYAYWHRYHRWHRYHPYRYHRYHPYHRYHRWHRW